MLFENVPTKTDYETSARILHFDAWPAVRNALWTLPPIEVVSSVEPDHIPQFRDVELPESDTSWNIDYEVMWSRHEEQQRYSSLSSIILAMTGFEHILRASITQVNPLLLLATRPKDWPKRPDRDFLELTSLDSEELPTLVNAISQHLLPTDAVDNYHQLRKLRNRAIHTHNAFDKGAPELIARLLLRIYAWHYKAANAWLSRLVETSAFHQADVSVIPSSLFREWIENFVTLEGVCRTNDEKMEDLGLRASDTGFRGLARRYVCPYCCVHTENGNGHVLVFVAKPAQISAERKNALFCHSCLHEYPVVREKCRRGLLGDSGKSCQGDVQFAYNNIHPYPTMEPPWRTPFNPERFCLTCLHCD